MDQRIGVGVKGRGQTTSVNEQLNGSYLVAGHRYETNAVHLSICMSICLSVCLSVSQPSYFTHSRTNNSMTQSERFYEYYQSINKTITRHVILTIANHLVHPHRVHFKTVSILRIVTIVHPYSVHSNHGPLFLASILTLFCFSHCPP